MQCELCDEDIMPLLKNGKVVWDQGNNGWPLIDGRVCDICNTRVLMARIIKSKLREKGDNP